MFNQTKAEQAIKFIELLNHVKGSKWAGQSLILSDWQKKIVSDLFGTVNEKGTRLYRSAFIMVPRKNGKSTLAAAIALYLLFMDGEEGAEIYSAASDREQASLVFNIAAQMVRSNKTLSQKCKIIDSQKRIVFYKTNSFYRAIPADAAGAHGYNAHAVIYDELHAAPNRDLFDTLTTSMGAREQPLLVMITTAGYDQNSICYEQYEYAKKVIEGTIEDPTYYAVIYESHKEFDDKDAWREANPNLDVSISTEFLEQEARRAKELPSYQNTFRRFYLNQWVQQQSRWIDLSVWDENAGTPLDENTLVGKKCYGGLDLSAVSDLTAWVMVFPNEEDPEEITVLCRFWCPEAKLYDSSNRYRDQYRMWAEQGYLKITPGDAIDYGFIKEQILEDAQKFDLIDLNIDRLFQGYQVGADLQEEGLTVVGMGQGFMSMAAPTKELERRLLARKVRHGGNPVLRFMADSVVVKQDAAGNLKPDKANSQARIDGIVALIMALDRAMRHEEAKRSVYEERGLLTL